jgi:hypothetical protein
MNAMTGVNALPGVVTFPKSRPFPDAKRKIKNQKETTR